MNISNLPSFYDIFGQASLSVPATGPTWNAWWSWSAWTRWREGQHLPLATAQLVSVPTVKRWWFVCGLVCHCVCGVCAGASRSER